MQVQASYCYYIILIIVVIIMVFADFSSLYHFGAIRVPSPVPKYTKMAIDRDSPVYTV